MLGLKAATLSHKKKYKLFYQKGKKTEDENLFFKINDFSMIIYK